MNKTNTEKRSLKIRKLSVNRETLRNPLTVTGECVKQAGQTGLFAKVQVEFEPYRGEESLLVSSRLKPDVLTPAFVTAAGALPPIGGVFSGVPLRSRSCRVAAVLPWAADGVVPSPAGPTR